MENLNNHNGKLAIIFGTLKKRKGLIIAVAVAVLIVLLPSPQPFQFAGETIILTREGQQTLALLAMVVVIFVTEALPIGALVALVYAWLVLWGIGKPKEIAHIFSHDAAWFLIGALMIAAVLVKYNLHKRLLIFVFKIVGGKVRNLVLGIVSACAISAAFIADHTIAAMMLPVALVIIGTLGGYKKVPQLSKLLLFSIAYGCAIGGLGTPSGGGRNVLMMGFLEEFFNINIRYGSWMIMALPITLILIPIVSFWLLKVFKPEVSDLNRSISQIKKEIRMKSIGRAEIMTLIIFFVVLTLWITKSDLGIGMIALLGSLLFLVFGLARWRDYQGINWGIGLLYFGAIGLGSVLQTTGAATWLAAKIGLAFSSFFGISGGISLVGTMSFLSSSFTQVMADGPAVATVGPVFLEMARITQTDPIIMGMAIALASAFAMCLIIGTPANAIIYGSGYVRPKDFLKAGLGLHLIALAILILVIRFWWIGVLGVGINGFH